jgi:hypothetical protein
MTPERVRAFREDYRREHIPATYSGWRHLVFTTSVCLAAIAVALWHVEAPRWYAWSMVPIGWLVANLVEYGMHRGPMHHLGVAARLYKRHTSEHHRFFSQEMMAVDGTRDFHVTLFPAWMALMFIGLIGVPAALLVWLVFGQDIALIFYAAIVSYYLVYEWLHLGAHMPEGGVIARLPFVGRARRHHGLHHDPARMRRANFNFAFPLGDWLFGTLDR